MRVCATICDQGSTNRAALASLVQEWTYDNSPSSSHFLVNGESIVPIFDVPHLLKCTRNAMVNAKIEYEEGKFASMDFIERAFYIDKYKKTFKLLYQLNEKHFNFKDNYIKMKVVVAARQLSQRVAATIECYHDAGVLPPEALQTAKFCQLMDNLFDSLNSSQFYNCEGKKYRCALSEGSPHIEFWTDLLPQLSNWKIIGCDGRVKNNFKFVDGWCTTIKSVIALWEKLKELKFEFLNLRNLNQDPLENLFGQIRQHGSFNTNPNCFQFVAALKTVIVNNLSTPITKTNCEEDSCEILGNFENLLKKYGSAEEKTEINNSDFLNDFGSDDICGDFDDDAHDTETNFATAYVAGYILKKIKLADCDECKKNLFSEQITTSHSFVELKENDKNIRLNYASEKLIQFLDIIHKHVYKFLDSHGHQNKLLDKFLLSFDDYQEIFKFCGNHQITDDIIRKSFPVILYKYLREKNISLKPSAAGNSKKIKIFLDGQLHPANKKDSLRGKYQ